MDLFEKIGSMAKAAANSAGDAIETTKINSKIGDEQNKIRSIKVELGDFIWQRYTEGMDIGVEEMEFCQRIEACQQQINEYNAQLNALRPKEEKTEQKPIVETLCASCEKPIHPGSTFCPFCGEDQSAAKTPEPGPKACPTCGCSVFAEAKFCPQCGGQI